MTSESLCSPSLNLRLLAFVLAISLSVINPSLVHAAGYSAVSINGVPLTHAQLRGLEQQLRSRVAPGHYLTGADGCWVNLSTGAQGCLGQSGDVHSRYGSGSRSADGSWNHWSDAAGGAVGGTSDGCVYTSFGWSNC